MWLIVLLLLGGAALLFLETMVPGGVLGAIGGLLLAAGVATAYLTLPTQWAHLVFIGVTVATLVGVIGWFRYFPRSGVAQRLGANATVPAGGGPDYEALVGRAGTTVTPLRPAGTADLDGRRLSVVTEGDYVPAAAPVRVVAVEGTRIVVRPTAEPTRAETSASAGAP